MSAIKLRVLYERYRRYEPMCPCIGHITSDSFRQAIIKMLSKVSMYANEEVILEREEQLGREMTQQEIIDMLYSENSDGCDYIISLTNEVTGEVYMDGSNFGFEEWSI